MQYIVTSISPARAEKLPTVEPASRSGTATSVLFPPVGGGSSGTSGCRWAVGFGAVGTAVTVATAVTDGTAVTVGVGTARFPPVPEHPARRAVEARTATAAGTCRVIAVNGPPVDVVSEFEDGRSLMLRQEHRRARAFRGDTGRGRRRAPAGGRSGRGLQCT
ncbi:hypothetical protein KNE206_31680 [Kitasatospora sp. NE20-6]